jgi:hypothetical protein
MEQSRVKELEHLLTEAIRQVVIRDGKNERMTLSDYRRNLASARQRHHHRLPSLIRNIELEIQDSNVQARALDLIRNELEPYIKDDRIHSATRVITGGHGRGSPVKDILTNVLRRAIVDGPDAAAQAFAECVTGSSCTYYVYSVLTGIQVSQEVEIFQQIKLIPLPSSVDNLPAHIPTLFGHGPSGPKVEDLLSKTLLRVEMEYPPSSAYHPRDAHLRTGTTNCSQSASRARKSQTSTSSRSAAPCRWKPPVTFVPQRDGWRWTSTKSSIWVSLSEVPGAIAGLPTISRKPNTVRSQIPTWKRSSCCTRD